MEIKLVINGSNGSFRAYENNVEAGFISFTLPSISTIILEHTEVFPEFSGKGIAKKLVLSALDYAKENNLTVEAVCEYAQKVIAKL